MQVLGIFFCLLFSSSFLFPTVGALDTSFGTSGTVSTSFQTTSLDGQNTACAVQQDGKIVVVGNANPGFAIARYTQEGVLDTTFNSGGSTPGTVVTTAIGSSASANGVAIDNQGRIVVCGVAGGNFAVARYLSNGSLDTANFNSGGSVPGTITTTITGSSASIAYGLVIDKSGNIVVCGGATISTGYAAIARYTSAGVLDTTFGTSSSGMVTTQYAAAASTAYGITLDSNSKILLCGFSSPRPFVARYTSAGALDTSSSFGISGQGFIRVGVIASTPGKAYSVLVDSNAKIVISGYATVSGVTQFFIARILSDASAIDTTFNAPSGYVTTPIGSTSIAYSIALDTNNNILMGGANTTNLFVGRYTSAGALDTTFNPSIGYNNSVGISAAPGISRFALQQNNELVIAATAGGSFQTSRFLGAAAPQGCMDTTYPTTLTGSDVPGYKTYPTDTTATNLPKTVAIYPAASSNLYTLTSQSGSTNTQLVELSSTGSVTSSAVVIAKPTPSDVITDSYDRALVIGTGASNGWIARYYNNAGTMTIDSAFNSGAVADVGSSSSLMRVCEQSNGRIVAIGQFTTNTTGMVIGFTSTGSVDTSFGYSGSPSYNTMANALFKDMIIDANDNIYIAYQYTTGGQQNIYIAKFLANGSGIDTSFASSWSGQANSGLPYANYTTPCLSFDAVGNIVLTAVEILTGNIAIQVWAPAGTGWPSPTPSVIAQTTSLLSIPAITKLQCDTNNRLIFTGYDANDFFVGRCDAGVYTLDATFAPYSSTPGLLKTMYNNNNPIDSTTPKRVSNSVCIAPSGAILFGGYENITSASTVSVVGQVVGDATPYTQVDRYPGANHIGTIDTNFGTSGALSLADSPASLPAGSAKSMYVLSNNKILVADTNGTDTVLGQLTSAYALDTGSFGSSTGKVTLTGLVNPKNIMIDTTGNIYVVGNGAVNMMLFKVTSAGVVAWSITSNSLTIANTVLQQTCGRIIVVGYNGSSGVIAGYNPTTGALDTTFGTSGYYTTGINAQVAGAAITTTDAIVFVYRDASANAIVNRLLSNGIVDGTFTFGTALASVSADISSQAQTKLQLDVNGKIIVVARNSTGNFIVSRYLSTGADDVSEQTITLTNASTSILVQALSLSNGTTLIIGQNTNGNTLEAARLTSACVLDTNFNYPSGILQTAVSPMTNFYGVDVTADQGILVTGASTTPNPYFTRIYDDVVVTKVNQNTSALGTPGTIDTNFGTSGYVALSGLGAGTPLAGATPLVVLPTSSGGYYMVFDNGKLARLTNNNALDTTFNAAATTNIAGLAVNDVPAGAFSMIVDGAGRLVVAGTDGSGHGWIQRYVAGNSGKIDTVANGGVGFNTTGKIDLGALTVATVVVEQTLGRYVVAGKNNAGNGALFAFTNTGVVDTTFGTNGVFDTGIPAAIYGLISDQYDRIILAIAYIGGLAVYVSRLTSSGQNDPSFGFVYSASLNTINGGAGILQNADIENQVRLAFDSSGNIVIAAHQNLGLSGAISVTAYDNGTSTVANSNGNLVYGQFDISVLTSPTLTGLITTADGKVLISGNQSASGSGTDVDMWVARVQPSLGNYALDTTFNSGGTNIAAGIMDFSFYGGSNPRTLSSIAIYGDGEIAMVGAETSTTPQPFLAMAYDTPYTIQIAACQNSKSIGTNDITLGASSSATTALGVVFYASATAAANSGQVARAVALQDDANILVAVDGGLSSGSTTPSDIFLKMFDIDGVPQTTFGTSGQQTVLSMYQNQFVNDMVTWTTIAGVHKAILAGYVTNTTLGTTSSLLLQYNLDTHALDTSFGGFNGNTAGLAFGDGKQINVVGQQSTGRIIAGGLSQNSSALGLLLGYTATGKLDTSFGNGGYQSTSSVVGSTGLYTHAIDTQNRILIAYNDGSNNVTVSRVLADGSGLDTAGFGTAGSVTSAISGISGNSNMRIAVDTTNQVIVAAVLSSGIAITIKSYSSAGVNNATLALTSSDLGTLTSFTITRLLVDTDGKVIVVGYDNAATDQIVVVRALADLSALDASFNANGTPGYIKYQIAAGAIQVATDALIHPDGRIIIVGSEN